MVGTSSHIFILSFTSLLLLIQESISNENLEFQRYIPSANDKNDDLRQMLSQIIMQGSDPRSDPSKWKTQIEKIDVRHEIEKLNITYTYQPDWPTKDKKLGAVSAVSLDRQGNVVIFHRVDRVWDARTFTLHNNYTQRSLGPIKENTVIAFNQQTGNAVYEWGKNLFYMPHGLTVDHEDNTWITDVALHQVMKFGPKGSADKPSMILGKPFESGKAVTLFCKPTAVAVLTDGDFFVSDGYCNSRILKFSKDGKFLLSWGRNTFQGEQFAIAPENYFAVPHALTLAPALGLICVADRENGRVQCFYATNGTFHSQFHTEIIGDRLFSVDFSPINGGQLFIVNGPSGGHPAHYNEVRGYVMDFKRKQVLSKFGPRDLQFSNPHDIAVTADGNEIYVAEIGPNKIHKFLNKKIAKNTIFMSAAKPTATLDDSTENSLSETMEKSQPGGSTALLVVSLVVIFALLAFGLALLIARRRKRGCYPFGVRNRRHAWDTDTRSKSDGFTLGNLLDRKRGFEKLGQNGSDEEPEPDATTNMLTSAQFA